MKKCNLKTGYIVTLRNKLEYTIYLDSDFISIDSKDILLCIKTGGRISLDDYDEELNFIGNHYYPHKLDYDIIKICSQTGNIHDSQRQLVWERNEDYKEMTLKNIEVELNYKIKIIS